MALPSRFIPACLLAAVLPLAGCEMLTGDKGKDGESIGYACRVSNKLPEDCMKENSAYTPTSILGGWKEADKDVREKKLEAPAAKGASAGESKAEGEPAAPEGKAEPKPAAAEEKAKPAAEEPAKH